MFIDFDDYPHYSVRESIIFEKDVNEAIKCEHGYAYSDGQHPICKWVNEKTWYILKKYFPYATKIYVCAKTVLLHETVFAHTYILVA